MPSCDAILKMREGPGVKHITCALPQGHYGRHYSEDEMKETPVDDRSIMNVKPVVDFVNHPPHYGGTDNPYEHIKVAEAMGWGYHIGNATKYIWRLGKKTPDRLQDAEKALWYLKRYIELIKKEEESK